MTMFIRVWSLVFGVWSFFKLKSPLKVGEVPRLRGIEGRRGGEQKRSGREEERRSGREEERGLEFGVP
jgi:hypothetical protein